MKTVYVTAGETTLVEWKNTPGGDGLHQSIVRGAADLEGHVGDALLLVPLYHFDEFKGSDGVILEHQMRDLPAV